MKTLLKTLFVMLTSFAFLSCTSDPKENVAEVPEVEVELAQGVTIHDLQADFSITASFRRGDDIIHLQAVRGIPTPEIYRNDPTFPPFEIDARITDEDGRIMYLRRGGDLFVDPTWQDDLELQDMIPPRRTPNTHLFEMIPEAMDALEKELMRSGQDRLGAILPEFRALHSFGAKARETVKASDIEVLEAMQKDDFLKVFDMMFDAGGGGSSSSDGWEANKSFISGWYKMSLHDKSCCMGAGRHSATRIHQLNYGSVYAYYDFCNHGECANNMSQICSLSQVHKPAWTAYTCSTKYDAKSQDGGHNCHDDSRLQMASFVFGPTTSTTSFWCNDGNHSCDISNSTWYGDQSGSPECNDSKNRGYNHPNMLPFNVTNTNSAQQNTANYNITLSAGATYDIYTCNGHSTGDTYLRLFRNGVQVSHNDDNCSSLQSYLTYTAPESGVYQIRAGCFGSNSCNGNVRVRLAGTTTSPPWNFYSVTNTNSAQQNTRNLYYYLYTGYTYTFETCGTSDTDTYLRLRLNGSDVAINDDACGLQSRVTFSPSVTGGYYLHAGCFGSGSCSGVVNMTSVQNTTSGGSKGDAVAMDEQLYYY